MAVKNRGDRRVLALFRDKTELPENTGVFWEQKTLNSHLLDVKSALISEKNSLNVVHSLINSVFLPLSDKIVLCRCCHTLT